MVELSLATLLEKYLQCLAKHVGKEWLLLARKGMVKITHGKGLSKTIYQKEYVQSPVLGTGTGI